MLYSILGYGITVIGNSCMPDYNDYRMVGGGDRYDWGFLWWDVLRNHPRNGYHSFVRIKGQQQR